MNGPGMAEGEKTGIARLRELFDEADEGRGGDNYPGSDAQAYGHAVELMEGVAARLDQLLNAARTAFEIAEEETVTHPAQPETEAWRKGFLKGRIALAEEAARMVRGEETA
jgi:hypothetical protein